MSVRVVECLDCGVTCHYKSDDPNLWCPCCVQKAEWELEMREMAIREVEACR